MSVAKLRHWKHADQGWFRDLDYHCFPTDEPFLNGENYHWWVVGQKPGGGRAIAYAGLYVDGDSVQFCRAGVLPAFRNQGHHRALIQARLRWARRRGYKVARTYAHLDNPRSMNNLRKAGFRQRTHKSEGYADFTRRLSK